MDTQKTPITCPQCRRVQTMKVPLKVNTLKDRGARERILSGALFSFVCTGCGYTAEVLPRGFLYQDPTRRLMVYLSPGGGEPLGGAQLPQSFARYRLRVVSDRVRLVEQILIGDAGLDDRHVMIFKSQVKPAVDRRQARPPEWTVFAGIIGEGKEVALSLPDGSVVGVPIETLRAAEETDLPDEVALVWQRIDADWARSFLAENPTSQRGVWWKRE